MPFCRKIGYFACLYAKLLSVKGVEAQKVEPLFCGHNFVPRAFPLGTRLLLAIKIMAVLYSFAVIRLFPKRRAVKELFTIHKYYSLTQGQFRVYQHGNMDVEQKKQNYQVDNKSVQNLISH